MFRVSDGFQLKCFDDYIKVKVAPLVSKPTVVKDEKHEQVYYIKHHMP